MHTQIRKWRIFLENNRLFHVKGFGRSEKFRSNYDFAII